MKWLILRGVATAALPVVNELDSWVRFLRAHAAVTRRLNSDLVSEHGLTLNDYEVLLTLRHSPGRRLRRVDLSERLILTPSGITRLLEGLEREGFVARVACDVDRRVCYAQLTDEGVEKLRRAAVTHVHGIDQLFLTLFTARQRAQLASLLGRLVGAGSGEGDCAGERVS